ncbi:amidohydrolase [Pseudemcibacter aquimaris]|uniref:amidohydrolase n=1 Tax=Pseudemcibacter aquimaris TaxID=2857064 RepID=UPI00201216BC|nr:amidohydrolase [Pseudemcibacter aquimaris]MCC3860192.1 amidohydrolase family protein [Pseudemcibacter aquimaris]WDU57517.1 amidohydrolase family protein [Pseudemcibacter aquimaris]
MKLSASIIAAGIMAFTSAEASTLLYNINGFTMEDGKLKQFSAIEYDEGKVLRTFKEANPDINADERMDGEGRTVLPGLIDTHGHISWHGRALSSVDLIGAADEKEAQDRVREFVGRPNSNGWLWGRGWNQEHWPTKEFPTKETLDALTTDIAIVLNRIDGHAVWVNSKTLELVGIDRNTPEPQGGQILKDENGEPTGVLVDTAMNLVYEVMPENDHETLQEEIMIALNDMVSLGTTSAHDAGIKSDEVRAMLALREKEIMPARVYAMLDILDASNDQYLEAGIITDNKAMMEIRAVKILSDGAMGSRGAAMLEDYTDSHGYRGDMLFKPEEMEHHMVRAMAHGFQVNTHAIGDRANREVLDMYERLQDEPLRRKMRHRVEHAQIIDADDILRFKELGVAASIHPTHATSDMGMVETRIGMERVEEGGYAWRTLWESGAHLGGGSDFPVEPVNPFYGLHAVITSQDRDGNPLDGWMPNQTLNREQAFDLFTAKAAFLGHQENEIGQLSPGYWADFIILDRNYFEIPAEDIWKIKVVKTFVAGKEVYSAN